MGKINVNFGKTTLVLTPEDLLSYAAAYFAYAENNPIVQDCVSVSKGIPIAYTINHIRPVTKQGFCAYLGVSSTAYERYRGRGEDWSEIMDMIDDAIYAHKFEHAATGLFNPTMMSRDLGLADRQELTGRNGGPLELVQQAQQDAKEFAVKMAKLAATNE